MKTAIVRDMIDVCHRLYARGFVAATDGNVSARLPSGSLLTTRAGLNKGLATEGDLVKVSANGQQLEGKAKPSTELRMHLAIYRQRPDVQAVVHAHPVYATAFAVAGIALDRPVLPEVLVGLGGIPLARYATPSTEGVGASLKPFIKHNSAILLQNHGVVTLGTDLHDAYFKMEKVEQVARIVYLATQLGGARELSAEEIEQLRSVATVAYGREIPKT